VFSFRALILLVGDTKDIQPINKPVPLIPKVQVKEENRPDNPG